MISIYSSLGQLNYLFVQMQLSKDYQTLTELKKKKKIPASNQCKNDHSMEQITFLNNNFGPVL